MHTVSDERDGGPGEPADDDADAHVQDQTPHATDRRCVVARLVFSKERMADSVVPCCQSSVELGAANRKVEEFYQRMEEEEYGDRVGCQVIDIISLLHEVDEQEHVLYHHETRHRRSIPGPDGCPAEAHVLVIVQQKEAGRLHDPDQRPQVRDQTL